MKLKPRKNPICPKNKRKEDHPVFQTVKMTALKTKRYHTYLPLDLLTRAAKIKELIGDADAYVAEQSVTEWVDGFCHDQHPEKEIKVWEWIAEGLRDIPVTPETWHKRNAIYKLRLAKTFEPADPKLEEED